MTAHIPDTTLVKDLEEICVFDLETTGKEPLVDRIVTAYLGRVMRSGEVRGSYSWIVNPGVPIHPEAAAIHGITDEVAQTTGKDARTAVDEILTVLRRSIATGRPTVAYNAAFDLTMLNTEAERYGLEPIDFSLVLDPLIIDKALDKYRKGSRKLVDAAKFYGVPLSEESAHDAEADAVATGRVAWAVLDRLASLDSLRDLHSAQIIWARDQAASLESYFARKKPEENIKIDGAWPVRSAPVEAAAA